MRRYHARAVYYILLLQLLAFPIRTLSAQGAETAPTGEDESIPWYEAGRIPIERGKVYSYLHEGNGCTQDRFVVINSVSIPALRRSWNDEARSMDFRGSTGTYVTVYDSRDYAQTDDFAVIRKTDNDPVCISTFENDEPGKWIEHRGYRIWYSGGNGLDGKVSSVRWGIW